jgi:hypothetical protein
MLLSRVADGVTCAPGLAHLVGSVVTFLEHVSLFVRCFDIPTVALLTPCQPFPDICFPFHCLEVMIAALNHAERGL